MQEINIESKSEMLTLSEVAQYLKVSVKTLYTWRLQGKISFVKLGGTANRIPKAELLKIIQVIHD